VLWLRHAAHLTVQPINPVPEPDGNIRVLLGDDGRMTGQYVVVPKRHWQLYADELHTPHVATCGNATARRLMRQRSRADGLDGDAPRSAVVPCADPGCQYPLPDVDLAAGERFHATCDPRFRGRRASDE
jgi:hypothetical protein